MSANILYVSSMVHPYISDAGIIGETTRFLPQQIQEQGMQVRIFMPRYGVINERRGQLHEVIRLSGMNLIIAGSDHQLIIKVASISGARLQVYFIDNEEYFSRKSLLREGEQETFMEDNDRRALFFSRGTLETVKKLRWAPELVHTHGWFSALTPLYIRKVYKNDPIFAKSKIVISLYNDDFTETLDATLAAKLKKEGMKFAEGTTSMEEPTYENLMRLAIEHCDGVVVASEGVNPAMIEFAKSKGVPVLEAIPSSEIEIEKQNLAALYKPFYDEILSK